MNKANQRATYCMTSFMLNVQNKEGCRHRAGEVGEKKLEVAANW